jgi:hypothetical protein
MQLLHSCKCSWLPCWWAPPQPSSIEAAWRAPALYNRSAASPRSIYRSTERGEQTRLQLQGWAALQQQPALVNSRPWTEPVVQTPCSYLSGVCSLPEYVHDARSAVQIDYLTDVLE